VEEVQPKDMEVRGHASLLLLCCFWEERSCRACAYVVNEVQPKSLEVPGHNRTVQRTMQLHLDWAFQMKDGVP
jgi:hypothetical protein